MRHIRDIQTARSHVGRDENADLILGEAAQSALALRLRFVAMDGIRSKTALFQAMGELVDAMLGAAEDEHFLELRLEQEIVQRLDLLFLGVDVHHVLIDVFRRRAGFDRDRHRIIEELLGKLRDFARHRRREEQ